MKILAVICALALLCTAALADAFPQYTGKGIRSFTEVNAGQVTRNGNIYFWRGGQAPMLGIPMGPAFRHDCRLEIRTNGAGIIQSIRITRETIGDWTLSRCSEVVE